MINEWLKFNDTGVDAIVIQFIQCQVSKDLSDKLLSYIVLKGEKINFGDIFAHNIVLTMQKQKRHLPNVCLVTYLLTTIGVSIFGEPIEKVTSFFFFF